MKLFDRFIGPKMAMSVTELKDRNYDFEQLDKYFKKFFDFNDEARVAENSVPSAASAFRRLSIKKTDSSEGYACVFNYALSNVEKCILFIHGYDWTNHIVGIAACIFKVGEKFKASVNGRVLNAEFENLDEACQFINPNWIAAWTYKESKSGYYFKSATRKPAKKV